MTPNNRRADIISRIILTTCPPTKANLADELYILTGERVDAAELEIHLGSLVRAGLVYEDAGRYLLTGRAMNAMVRAVDDAARALVLRETGQ